MTVVEEMTAYRNALLNESFSESLGGRDYIIRYEPDSERNPMYVKDSIGEDETPNKMLAYKFTKILKLFILWMNHGTKRCILLKKIKVNLKVGLYQN